MRDSVIFHSDKSTKDSEENPTNFAAAQSIGPELMEAGVGIVVDDSIVRRCCIGKKEDLNLRVWLNGLCVSYGI